MRNLENSSNDPGKKRPEDKQHVGGGGRLNRSFSGYSEPNTSKATYSSYNDFLKNYGSKKFSAVRADFARGEAENGEKKTVKSEIFIQVRDPKISNGNSDTTDFVSSPPPKTWAKPPLKPDLQRVQIQKLTIIDNSSHNGTEPHQNFSNYRQVSPTPKSPDLVPDEMIYAKTAVLNELMRRSSPIQDHEIHEEPNSKNDVPPPKPPVTNGIPPPPKMPEFSRPKILHPKPETNVQKPVEVFIPPPPPKFLTQKSQSAGLEANTTTIVPVVDASSNVNKTDPNVKKLVYNTYRGFLGAYNNKANDFVATLPRNMVFKDRGVNKQVESMAAQGPTGPPGVGRHKSDISDNRRPEPPLCVQNAMLTKDKKPFTYTPGGIDLSEIKSPRMARRIERNAMAPGVGDFVQPPPPQGPVGPLPPSALAAMQPALPVQVFPSGPPPAPPANIPPPPPPMMPLPTKPVATTEGVFERPDMTKIIPENPMALLRKTSGVNRRSCVEEPDYTPVRQQNYNEPPRPQFSQAQVQMQPQRPQPRPQMASQPQYGPSTVPAQDSPPEVKTSTAQLGSLYIPPVNTQEATASPPAAPQRRVQTPEQSPESPLATLNKAPRPWQNQKSPQPELPPWAQRSQSPPPAQQQSPPTNAQPQRYSPPPPQQQQQQQRSPVPQQPRLVQQVRPPQQQQQPPAQPTIVGRVIIPVQMEAPPTQNNKNVDAVFITQPVVLQHPGDRPETNANQQQRFVQPNQAPQQQQKVVQPPEPARNQGDTMKGTRIIPIQIEGASNANVQRQDSKISTPGTTPATPGTARSFTRQPSWSSTPTQSNSFKVIQKMTNTDGEDDDDQITSEHSPRNSQNFQQVPADQLRKMKLNESDRDLMNKIKQGVDEDNSIHKEADPRYRGATIPSKAFRFLQSMTDGSDADAVSASVPRSPQSGGGSNRGPQVRTIPVQIEGDNSGKPYVPPSEQTVQEPKKYTGSAIPSRSFKILQAMTGDTCADVGQANETNENYRFDPSYYHWGCNPGFMPMPPPVPLPPYWQYYCSPCPTPSSDSSKDTDKKPGSRSTPVSFKTAPDRKQKSNCDSESSETSSTRNKQTNFESDRSSRSTPLPFWNYRQSPSKQTKHARDNDVDYQSDHSRSTPLPFWNYYPSSVYPKQKKCNGDTDSESDLSGSTPLPFWSYHPQHVKQPKNNADTDSESDRSRGTPLPFWGCYSPFYPIPYSSNETDSETEPTKSNAVDQDDSSNESENYPPFWSPYSYYPYFYGYPPPPPLIYPYPFYPPVRSDTDETAGYSSTDEMAYYNARFNREKTSSLTPTPTSVQVDVESDAYEEDLTGDETETEVEEEQGEDEPKLQRNLSLQAIKSVSDINVYNIDYATNCTDDEGDNVSEGTTTDDNDDVSVYTEEEEEEEVIPHQLSVIYEESERSDASRMIRESSVATTVSVETVTMCNIEDFEQYPIITEPEEEQMYQANYTIVTESVEVSPENYVEESSNSIASDKNDLDTSSVKNEVEETKSEKSTSSEEKDWWSVIGNNEDETYTRRTNVIHEEIGEAIENPIAESNANEDEIYTRKTDVVHEEITEAIEDPIAESNANEDEIYTRKTDAVHEEIAEAIENPIAESNAKEDEIYTRKTNEEITEAIETLIAESNAKERDDSIDFWKIIEDDEPQVKPLKNQSQEDELEDQVPESAEQIADSEINGSSKQSSTSSSDSSSVCSESSKVSEKMMMEVEERPPPLDTNEGRMPSIKDRIRALQEASKNKFDLAREGTTVTEAEKTKSKREKIVGEAEAEFSSSGNELKSNEKEDFYETAKTKSSKSSVKSFEDISEDEMDSGVTSDVSRHISDNESDFPELRKMTKYQRAATHSRLFKLLQEGCEREDDDEESVRESTTLPTKTASMERKNAILKEQLEKEKLNEEILMRRESLSLPLNNSESDSFSSSGINSPGSPVINERLVNELVHSLLRRKKGHIFKNMSMEKLHSAAIRILQEELESSSTSYEEFLSPIKSSPHANYAEYMQYYDSWSEAERLYQESYDILPSKTFKLIQEQAVMNKTGGISGFLARCPRVLSSKNVHKELISVLESRESPVPNTEVETKGAASAS